MKSIAFIAVFGLYPGYNHDKNIEDRIVYSEKDFSMLWHRKMQLEYEFSGVLVSSIFNGSRALYPMNFGCPLNGEITVSVFGEMNPVHCLDEQAYKDATIRICQAMRKELEQTTVRVSFFETESHYLRD